MDSGFTGQPELLCNKRKAGVGPTPAYSSGSEELKRYRVDLFKMGQPETLL